MRQFVVETRVKKGHLAVDNVPFSDETEVKVFVIPKVTLTKMSFPDIRKLTESIKGNLSEEIETERNQK
ncbi:MAG: hypothetical protein QY317_01770 [Candidatus Jettenia caeni]|nr:MAG: hypothetical protein QY317_01770 [Candidatus Jettenia caeni]